LKPFGWITSDNPRLPNVGELVTVVEDNMYCWVEVTNRLGKTFFEGKKIGDIDRLSEVSWLQTH